MSEACTMRMDGIPERRCTGNSEKHTDSQVDEKLVLIIAYNAGHMGYTEDLLQKS
jgi:hypothetical protein